MEELVNEYIRAVGRESATEGCVFRYVLGAMTDRDRRMFVRDDFERLMLRM
jgi:hypothetical protein